MHPALLVCVGSLPRCRVRTERTIVWHPSLSLFLEFVILVVQIKIVFLVPSTVSCYKNIGVAHRKKKQLCNRMHVLMFFSQHRMDELCFVHFDAADLTRCPGFQDLNKAPPKKNV